MLPNLFEVEVFLQPLTHHVPKKLRIFSDTQLPVNVSFLSLDRPVGSAEVRCNFLIGKTLAVFLCYPAFGCAQDCCYAVLVTLITSPSVFIVSFHPSARFIAFILPTEMRTTSRRSMGHASVSPTFIRLRVGITGFTFTPTMSL